MSPKTRLAEMKEKAEASEKKKNAGVKRRQQAAAKRRAAIKKRTEAAKRSETAEKKRKRDSGLDGGSSSNPTKKTRNRVIETAASPPEHQGVHAPTPAAELLSQGDSEGTPCPVIPSQPQKSPTPTHAVSEAENQQQPRVISGSSTKSPSHRVDEQNGEETGKGRQAWFGVNGLAAAEKAASDKEKVGDQKETRPKRTHKPSRPLRSPYQKN
ncbi:hypothetical protein YC2023_001577 [Brassica napus]